MCVMISVCVCMYYSPRLGLLWIGTFIYLFNKYLVPAECRAV